MKNLITLLILIFPLVVFTQEKKEVTLQSLIDEAVSRNAGLQSAKSRVQSADARVPQVKAWDDPQAGVEFFATPITSANPFKDGMETDYFIQQMIPFPGKKGFMGDAATANVRMVEQSAKSTERNLIAQVKQAYAMLYSAQRRLDVNEENQKLLNQIIESARAKYSVGLITQGDVLKVQVELSKLQNDRSVIEQELASAQAMMNALRSLPSSTAIGHVADLVPQRLTSNLNDLITRALNVRPEIQGMKYGVDMNKFELSAAKREWFPDFMVRGMYKQMVEGTDQWAAMIGINIPIAPWGIGKYSGRVDESEANVRATEQSLVDMENMAQAEVRDTWAKAQSRWQQIERYQQTILPQAEQSLQSTLVAYQTDRTDFLSLLDTYRMVQMFKMEYYMVVGEYFSNVASLEKAIGENL